MAVWTRRGWRASGRMGHYAPRCTKWDERPRRGDDRALGALDAPSRYWPGVAGLAGADRRGTVAGGACCARAADRADRLAAGVRALAGGGAAAPLAAALAGDLAGVRGAAGGAGGDRLFRRDDGGRAARRTGATGATAVTRRAERRTVAAGAAPRGSGHPARSD